MCFSAKASLSAFIIGLIGAALLISKGDRNNISFGVFFIFISLIQLMDFAIWTDLSNKTGLNRLATIIGPLLNVGQPLIMYFIKILVFTPFIIQIDWFFYLNAGYALYLVKMYYDFISNEKLVTNVEKGHLKWPWLKYANPAFYLIMFVLNAFYLTDFQFSLVVSIITGFFLFMSHSYFAYHVGEVWCYFGAFIPMMIYFLV